jgi:hypothetical protein
VGQVFQPAAVLLIFSLSICLSMRKHHVSETTIIAAPAQRVYAVLADYRVGHPGILPQPPFHSYELEAGGQGAGTIIRFKMTALGRTENFRGVVTEPAPGRVLVETYVDTKTVTTFTVEPHGDGNQSRVTFATDLETRSGLSGVLERFFVTRFLKKTYRREMKNLADVAARP